jgi:lysophospholipase L1-like esterase
MRLNILLVLTLLAWCVANGQLAQAPATDSSLEKFHPLPAPKPAGLVLKKGDKLAICGDSITEQKMYSRIMEDYLTVCVPELEISVRQYGWSGERAPGFLARMTNDCLRFKPTIATTCYGMNDHEYRAYEDRIGQTYEKNSDAIVEAFKANGVRVILGSPGCVGKVPGWSKATNNTLENLNLNLCTLRNIDIKIAEKERVGFADVFWPMLTGGVTAQKLYGTNYAVAGGDGVHPGWAGHTVMAFAFLKAMGLDGDIGTFTVDMKERTMKVSKGHEVISSKDGAFEIRSSRYPLCGCEKSGEAAANYPTCEKDEISKDSSIRSGMTLVPFNHELNRLMLVVKSGNALPSTYRVTWGDQRKTFSGKDIEKGINLTEAFPENPFCEAFAKVDAAVAAKQAYETKQIKQSFRSPEAKADMEAIVTKTEAERAPLAAAIKAAFVPVTYTLKIQTE